MIPDIFYPDVLIPLDLDLDPLNDKNQILEMFSDIKDVQVFHMSENILKPSILTILKSKGLYIDKIDVWGWNLTESSKSPPHTDGNFFSNTGRQVGLNWSLSKDNSRVDFFNHSQGSPKFEDLGNRSHTFWEMKKETVAIVSWKNRYPSLLNTQTPHLVTGPPGEIRYSITVKFKGNPTFDDVVKRLWDLRLDVDHWPVNFSKPDLDNILTALADVEQQKDVVQNLGHKISSYKLPLELSDNIVKILKKYTKRTIKSLRIFHMQPGYKTDLHIDYDKWLDKIPRYALNIPIFGCEDSCVEFYRNLGDQGKQSNDTVGVGGYLYPTDMSRVFYSSTLFMLEPTMIRIDVPHLVNNFSNHERKILSVRFFEEDNDLPSDIILLTN
jgi:Holliday junction resolvase RusA-like endonuclease